MQKAEVNGLSIAFATVVAALVAGLLPASTAATPPAPVTFIDNEAVAAEPFGPGFTGAGTSVGTSTASGAVAGTFALSEQFMFGDGTIHIRRTLTAADGMITMSLAARFVGGTATTLTVQGYWTITAGNGSYAGLHGNGAYAATVDTTNHTITATLTGFGLYDAGSY
jgi:hypothetical protein